MGIHLNTLNPFKSKGLLRRARNELFIHIPTPCHESWEDMTPVEQGRFCQSCAKKVVDFSMMTDQQVLNYFAKTNGNTCGRFNNQQLQRPLLESKPEKKKGWWIAAIMPLMMLLEKGKAQSNNKEEVIADSTYPVTTDLIGDTILQRPVTKAISGKVINKSGGAIAYAAVTVEGANTIADSAGFFNLNFPVTGDTLKLKVFAAGYITKNIDVLNDTTFYAILLDAYKVETTITITDTFIISGNCTWMVSGFTQSVTIQSTMMDDVLKMFTPQPFKVYPNPAKKEGTVNITVKTAGDYYLQLVDERGNITTMQKLNATVRSAIPFTLPAQLATGVYFIRLIDERKKKQYTQKLMVM